MKIVGIHLEPGVVGWLRCWNWTTALERRGHTITHRPHAGTQFKWDEIDDLLRGADVVIAGRMHNAQVFAALLAGRKLYGYKLVVDTDDNVDALQPYNFAYTDYHDATGVKRIIHAQLREADLVTVSTRRLAEWAKSYADRVVVQPNCVDMSLYRSVRSREKEKRHRGDLRIYWGGGGGHYDDLLTTKDALLRICAERPNVKLVFSNFIPDWAADLPPFQVYMIRFAPFTAYHKVLKWLCADVAIAPLVDNEFNRCKSNVKYLSYAMADVPGVYQDLEPYENVIHGLTGLKATTPETWYEAINTLLDNRVLADAIASRARQDVVAHYNVADHVVRYETMLNELLAPVPALTILDENKPIEVTTWATR